MTRQSTHPTLSLNVIKGTVLLMMLLVSMAFSAGAQEPDKRHVTPVKPETNKVQPPPKGTDEKIIQQYISGDSAEAVAEARRDSLRRVYHHYPLLTDLSIGIDISSPLLKVFGQSYANTGIHATLNMWNRLQPTVELGLGWAKNTPDGMNFTYHCKPSPYFKVGVNYNLMFKNSPDYQAIVGLRLGYSPFSYEVTDVNYVNNYWLEYLNFDLTGLHSHALWGEGVVGLKVRIIDRFSVGWLLHYHGIFNYGKNEHAKPWYIPGYGPRGSSLGFSLSVCYTLPLYREEPAPAKTTSTTP